MSNEPKIFAAILAGGIGSRFWPLSRETTPKQLLSVAGDESLLKSTIRRLDPLIKPADISIVTSAKQAEIIRYHLDYDPKDASPDYVVEPVGKNTAPAIGLAALRVAEKDPDAVMAVLPADHLIKEGEPFRASLVAAAKCALKGHLVTFGITPTSPETGYGYIKSEDEVVETVDGFTVSKVKRFVEKPDIERAKAYLAEGGYFWNSGIFVWKASKILEEIKTHLPTIYTALMEIKDGADLKKAYEKMEGISIDHGILEKTDICVVIEANFPWSDMGSWNSLGDIFSEDSDGNIIKGRVIDIGSKNSIIMASERVVATIGLTDTILVDTPDATLVCPRERAQEVKDLVGLLKEKDWIEHELHPTVDRPWGFFTVLEEGAGYKVKKIQVKPGRRLSLQSHEKRSEHWVVITGTALIQRGEEVLKVKTNESTYIPIGVKHRLENPGTDLLEIIEVQNGAYLGEDDIIRYEDDFERS
ncbi:MAG: mannose-1-phosphate guanylyltransferase/mannose-6-phosphate isomerase [Thermodesulfobacteriota bacterium]